MNREPTVIRKAENKIEGISGLENLPEGEAVRVYTEQELRSILGLKPTEQRREGHNSSK